MLALKRKSIIVVRMILFVFALSSCASQMVEKQGINLSEYSCIKYRIVEEYPSQEDVEETLDKISKRAKLYDNNAITMQEENNDIAVYIPKSDNADDIVKELESLGEIYFVEFSYDANDKVTGIKDMVLDGTHIKDVGVAEDIDSEDEYEVGITLNDEGARLFEDATRRNIGKQIAIVYDDEIISAPIVNEPIINGYCSITGHFTYDQAFDLAESLRLGALPLHLEVVEQ